jgi:hypothetical protein
MLEDVLYNDLSRKDHTTSQDHCYQVLALLRAVFDARGQPDFEAKFDLFMNYIMLTGMDKMERRLGNLTAKHKKGDDVGKHAFWDTLTANMVDLQMHFGTSLNTLLPEALKANSHAQPWQEAVILENSRQAFGMTDATQLATLVALPMYDAAGRMRFQAMQGHALRRLSASLKQLSAFVSRKKWKPQEGKTKKASKNKKPPYDFAEQFIYLVRACAAEFRNLVRLRTAFKDFLPSHAEWLELLTHHHVRNNLEIAADNQIARHPTKDFRNTIWSDHFELSSDGTVVPKGEGENDDAGTVDDRDYLAEAMSSSYAMVLQRSLEVLLSHFTAIEELLPDTNNSDAFVNYISKCPLYFVQIDAQWKDDTMLNPYKLTADDRIGLPAAHVQPVLRYLIAAKQPGHNPRGRETTPAPFGSDIDPRTLDDEVDFEGTMHCEAIILALINLRNVCVCGCWAILVS